MAPVVEEIRRTAEARLRELAPLVAEARQLEELLATLDESDDAPSSLARVRARRVTRPEVGRNGRAPHGANKRRIVNAVADHPGIAAPEVAALTGLKRAIVASTICRLKRTGELQAWGDGVRLPGEQTTHVAA